MSQPGKKSPGGKKGGCVGGQENPFNCRKKSVGRGGEKIGFEKIKEKTALLK